MKTPKLPSFLARKNLLKRKEESDYQANKGEIQRRRYLEEIKQLKRQNKVESRNERYASSRTGKLGSGLSRGIRAVRSPTNYLYSRNQLPKKVNRGAGNGKRGRPAGTLDQRYAQYGGVYGYRKAMAQRRFIERQQILQERTVTPQQQQILNNIRARENYQRQNPESKIFPDTDGSIALSGIMDEINRASNIFP